MDSSSVSPATAAKTYASFVADIDVANETRPAPDSNIRRGPCRRIICNSAGNINLQYADKTTDLRPVTLGQVVDGQVAKILTAGTTITSCTVEW